MCDSEQKFIFIFMKGIKKILNCNGLRIKWSKLWIEIKLISRKDITVEGQMTERECLQHSWCHLVKSSTTTFQFYFFCFYFTNLKENRRKKTFLQDIIKYIFFYGNCLRGPKYLFCGSVDSIYKNPHGMFFVFLFL